MLKGQSQTEEAKQRLREARAKQVHPSLAARGLTYQDVQEALAKGLRWCCGDCKAFLDASLFSPAPSSRKCKKCVSKRTAKWRERLSPEEARQQNESMRDWRIRRADYVRKMEIAKSYGVSVEWYDEQLARQDGMCALCPATKNTGKSRYFCIDHHHESGKVRELLCHSCNYLLGFLERKGQIRKFVDGAPDVEWGQRATEYLLRHKQA